MKQQGFTLIEILVAIALLGLLTAVLTGTLTGSLGLNRQAQQQLSANSQGQRLIETARQAWTTGSNYDSACVPGLNVPSGYVVRFINLDNRAAPMALDGTAASSPISYPVEVPASGAACAGNTGDSLSSPAAPPAMRRVRVVSGTYQAATATAGEQIKPGPQGVDLTLDLLRPLP